MSPLLRATCLISATLLPAVAPAQSASLPAPPARTMTLMAVGGSVGSLVGMGVVGLVSNCGVDDLACTILSVGAGGAAGALGATLGAHLVARNAGVRSSALGAGLGAVVGTGIGLGVHYLLNQGTDRNFDTPWAVVPIFVLAQGIFAALGTQWIR